jgi:hypothetical protein
LSSEEINEEQKKWLAEKMGPRKVGSGSKSKTNSRANGKGEKQEETVYKYSGKGQAQLRESVIIAGIPYFIKKTHIEKRNEEIITVEPYIEEAIKTLRPPFREECPYIPYEFKSPEEPNLYLQRAKRETIDSIYQKVKYLVKAFDDVGEETLTVLSADIVASYFQDRCSTVHYLFILGDNGTGKSALGHTFECLGYRAVNITNTTESFWFRVFGTNEAGQVTIIAEEFERIDDRSQIMAMLKEGYHPNAKVPRMNNENTKMDFFLPFGFKIMIAERSPDENKAKGLLDRCLPIKTYRGIPKYDIKEVRNPQGNTERQRKLNQIVDLRRLLLSFRVEHFKDPLPEVDIGLDGRDKELCKPLLQLFYGLGASEDTLSEIEKALKHFLDIKNNRKDDSLEARVYPIIVDIVSKYGNENSTSLLWDHITGSIGGYFDKYLDKEGNECIKNPNVFHTLDSGNLYRISTIRMIRDKFGAEMKHKNTGNVLVFDPNHLVRAGKIYGKTKGIQTKLLVASKIPMSDDSDDSSDAGDALLEEYLDPNSITPRQNGAQKTEKYKEGYDIPLHKGESSQSPQSLDPKAEPWNRKVKCPTCDYQSEPFYIKTHQCPNEDKNKNVALN